MLLSGPSARWASPWTCRSCRKLLQKKVALRRRHASSVASALGRNSLRKLPDTPARTRFAPSPTGFLHLGSLRTALFNYLIAKATKGQFLLRIEDTDSKRTVTGAEDRICSDLAWAGLQWDEGPQVGGPYGPYRQSERTELYREHTNVLLDTGHAYRCFCTTERLNELARERAKIGLPTDYDRTCASISKEESDDRAHRGENHTVRLKVPALYPEYQDLVYGRVGKKQKPGSTRKHGETVFEDPILMKSDGLPTYHLANVVDDHLMKITHVVRAAEWMPSTPKHLALYEAFGWTPPAFAHVGLLQDAKGQKLSKRNADIDIDSYRSRGIFPDALLNFCALLGWSHTGGNDFMQLNDLVENFSMKFTKGNTLVTFKKLDFLQRQHGQKYVEEGGQKYEMILGDIQNLLRTRKGEDSNWSLTKEANERKLIASILAVDAQKSGYQSAEKFLDQHKSFFVKEIIRDEPPSSNLEAFTKVHEQLRGIPANEWNSRSIQALVEDIAIQNAATTFNTQPGDTQGATESLEKSGDKMIEDLRTLLNKYLRWAIFSHGGPPIATAMAILGRETCVARLAEAESRL